MKTIYESDSNYTSPLMKWGIEVGKMRRKAFQSYSKDYDKALLEWPEFQQEFDYNRSLQVAEKVAEKPKRDIKRVQLPSFLARKNFFRYLLTSE